MTDSGAKFFGEVSEMKRKRPCIAFKMNYCDGGSDKDHVGFYGICSNAIIKYNIATAKHAWCSDDDCACKKFFDGKISPEELDRQWEEESGGSYPCYESALLRDWVMDAGSDKDGKPRPIREGEENHLCVLTTKYPNMHEESRFVFAMFIMRKIFPGDDEESGFVSAADGKFVLEFRPREAAQIKFWDYYQNPNAPQRIQWGSGLIRYFDDAAAVKFLERAVEVKRGTPEEGFAKEFLKQYPYK